MSRCYYSTVDKIYRHIIGGCVFPHGWGDTGRVRTLIEFHKVMSNREKVQALIDPNPDVRITGKEERDNFVIHSGYLLSPFAKYCPGLLPEVSEYCYFQFIVPKHFKSSDKAVAIHMAGTGDQYFLRRRILLAGPLATENGVSSIIIENPFYGSRRPPNQIRSNVGFVSDIFVMGGGLMLESLTLLRWLEKEGFGPFCMTGISMGGHMASLGATNYPKPIGIAPCLSWTTASSVFTRGVMANSVNWKECDATYSKYLSFRNDVYHKLRHYQLDLKEDGQEKTDPSQAKNITSVSKVFGSPLLLVKKCLQTISDFPKRVPEHVKRNFPSFPPLSSVFNLGNSSRTSPFVSFSTSSFFLPKLKRRADMSQRSSFEDPLHLQGNKESREPELKLKNFYCRRDTATRRESIEFMRRLMDHFTHLSNFEKPIDPELATVVCARSDAYVLRDGVKRIEEIWPGCTVRYLNAGHVVAYVRYHDEFRQAICDSLEKHRRKYNTDGTARIRKDEPKELPPLSLPLSIGTTAPLLPSVSSSSSTHVQCSSVASLPPSHLIGITYSSDV